MKLLSFTSWSWTMDGREIFKKAWCTLKVGVLPNKLFAFVPFSLTSLLLMLISLFNVKNSLTLSLALTFAPCSNNSSTTNFCPYQQARWRGVKENYRNREKKAIIKKGKEASLSSNNDVFHKVKLKAVIGLIYLLPFTRRSPSVTLKLSPNVKFTGPCP